MSPVVVLPAALLYDSAISAVGKLVAGFIFVHGEGHGRWCTPKQTEIAAALKVTRETVNRCVKALVKAGWLETRNVTSPGRGREGLAYRLRLDLSDDLIAAALSGEEKKRSETADVSGSSHREKADVIQASQPVGRCDPTITEKGADVILESPHIGADVMLGSLPYRENNLLTLEDTSSASKEASEVICASKAKTRRSEVPKAVALWNDTASRMGWSQCAKITQSRRQAIANRLNEYGFEMWADLLDRATKREWIANPESRPLKHRNWRPDIDWFSREKTWLRFLEEPSTGVKRLNGFSADEQRKLCELHVSGHWPSDVSRDAIHHFPASMLAEFGIVQNGRTA